MSSSSVSSLIYVVFGVNLNKFIFYTFCFCPTYPWYWNTFCLAIHYGRSPTCCAAITGFDSPSRRNCKIWKTIINLALVRKSNKAILPTSINTQICSLVTWKYLKIYNTLEIFPNIYIYLNNIWFNVCFSSLWCISH